jgi:MerR family transcriptional regulator, light-induced transcriptional regulator
MAMAVDNQPPSDYPLYNIGAVSRMTGISIATLRMWEHRYGFPQSGRTAGGHRLYSERDVVRLRWVKGQIDQGMQTAQAVNALHHNEETVETAALALASAPAPDDGPLITALPVELADLTPYRDALLAALLDHDTAAADRLLGEILLSQPLSRLIYEVIVPVLDETGRGWQEGRINVATEHFATNYVRQRLMMWMLAGPPPFPVHPVVLAAAPGELHEGSLLMLGALLRRRRWPVAYLGQTVPLQDLAAFASEMQAPAVVLVAMTEPSAAALADWPRYMPDALRLGKPFVGFGGRVFTEKPEWRQRVPGVFLGESLEEGLETIDRLLQGQPSRA